MKLQEKFDDYLKDIHAKQYMGTDDNLPDAFDDFISNATGEEMLGYMRKFVSDLEDKELQAMAEDQERKQLEITKYV